MKRARAIEDLLVLFIIVAFGVRLTDGSDDVFWPVAVILARPVSSYSIMAVMLNLERSSRWWSPRMKGVMTSASVMLGIEFLISEKHRM